MKKTVIMVFGFLLMMFSFNNGVHAEEKTCIYKVDNIFAGTNYIIAKHTIYIKYDENNYSVNMTVEKLDESYSKYIGENVKFDDEFTYDVWMNAIEKTGGCPYYIYVGFDYPPYGTDLFVQTKKFGFFDPWIKSWGRRVQKLAMCDNCSYADLESVFSDTIDNCSDLIGGQTLEILQIGMNYIKIIVPILVIVLGTFDMVKAVLSSTEDEMKKAQKMFFRRVIIAVLIFLTPYLINILIDITNSVVGISNSGTCNII